MENPKKQEKRFTLLEAIDEIEKYWLNRLHKEKNIFMTIEMPPEEGALAWFNHLDNKLYITADLSQWTPELLYVLPLHEEVHRMCWQVVEDYEDGYHNEIFRKVFETMSGMYTYHDPKIGWQFIEKVGERYIAWLEIKKEIVNEIFDIIAHTDLPKKAKKSGNKGESGEPQEGDGDPSAEQKEKDARGKMNKALQQNLEAENKTKSNEKQGQEGEKTQDQQKNQDNEAKDTPQGGKGDYKGQTEDVVVKGGKKKFAI